MLTPGLFNENFDLFDHFYQDPWFGFNDREFKNLERKLYGHRAKNVMSTDIRESENEYEMTVDLPGFNKDEVKVALEDGYLTISAEKSFESGDADDKEKKSKYIRKERYSGACERSFYVGDGLKTEDIKANFQHGILKLSIPKTEQKALPEGKYIAIDG